MFRDEALLGLVGVEAPEIVGRVDGGTVLGDLEVDGRVGRALHDDHLVAGAGELWSDVAARGALAVAAGEWRQVVHAVAVAAEHRRAVDRPGHEDQLVGGAEGVDLGADLLEQIVRADTLAADVVADQLGRDGLFGPFPEVRSILSRSPMLWSFR